MDRRDELFIITIGVKKCGDETVIGSLPLRSCRRDELFIIDVKKCSMYAAKSQVDLNLVPTHSLFIFIRLFDDDTTKKKKKKKHC